MNSKSCFILRVLQEWWSTQRFVETLNHEESCLTYPALVGLRKQSVKDAERLFSCSLLEFMEKKGYTCEADYICPVSGWRRVCDERGLSELQRCRFNYQILNYILKELMPWYHQTYDFSVFEVNRYRCKVLLYDGRVDGYLCKH